MFIALYTNKLKTKPEIDFPLVGRVTNIKLLNLAENKCEHFEWFLLFGCFINGSTQQKNVFDMKFWDIMRWKVTVSEESQSIVSLKVSSDLPCSEFLKT